MNEAIGEKDEDDADVDVTSLTRLQVRQLFDHVSISENLKQCEPWAAMILRDVEARRRKAMEVCTALMFRTIILDFCTAFHREIYGCDWHLEHFIIPRIAHPFC